MRRKEGGRIDKWYHTMRYPSVEANYKSLHIICGQALETYTNCNFRVIKTHSMVSARKMGMLICLIARYSNTRLSTGEITYLASVTAIPAIFTRPVTARNLNHRLPTDVWGQSYL